MEFAEACCEVEFILKNLQPSDKEKIPDSVFEFFKNNKSLFYRTNLSIELPLEEQKLKDETKAFLQIIYYRYFADENQKEELKKIIETNDDNIFYENKNNLSTNTAKDYEISGSKEMIVYKENKIIKILKSIFRFIKHK